MLHLANQVSAIPCLGVGLGYRRELREATLAARADIDFLEVITEHYTGDDSHALRELEEISSLFPVIPHGVSLSIGSMTPLDKPLLQGIKRVCEMTQAPYYSEHLCMTSVPGIDLGHLSPLWFTEEVLRQVIRNVTYVQEYLARPLILENVTYYFDIPGNSMSQAEFFNRLIAATGCGILLDITNVFINSVNHGFDPVAFLDQMPLDHVVQVHLAGGYWFNDYLVDGHSERVQEESWELLCALAARCRIKGVIFEHDRNFPDMVLLLRQVQRAKRIVF